MAGIVPIPNTRVSNLLLRQRLTQQFQTDQLDLFRLQEQISTGQRISLPSEDAPAALRAIALQRLLERKSQLETNIQGGRLVLSATDTAIADVAKELADLKGATLGVAGTVTTQSERDSAITQVNQFFDTLVGIANRQFQGRYLFAGTQSSQQPYSIDGDSVLYSGDDYSIRNYADLGVLFATNATGQSVFGGISEPVTGSVDLNPQLNSETRLSSLRGGRGISSGGAISISDGNNISTIDISGARTVGDVVRLIEENPPQGHTVEVQITGNGISLSLDTGTILISEVGNGSTARELGILELAGAATKVGSDLDPILLKTTALDNLLGTKARALLDSGANNDNADILLEATSNGAALDGVTIQFVDDSLLHASPGLTAGNEAVEYVATARAAFAALSLTGSGNDLIVTANDGGGTGSNNVQINFTDGGAVGDVAVVTYNALSTPKVLNIAVDNTGATTVQTVIDAIALEGNFTAAHDESVEGAGTYNPAATIEAADIGAVQGNTGNSGGAAKTLYVRIDPGNSDANQVAAAINSEGTFSASLDPSDTTSPTSAGTGKVNLNQNGIPAVTSGGSGASLDQASGIRVVNGGQTFNISFAGAETVEDLLNILNSSEAGLLAEVNAKGTGINVRSRLSGHDFQIGEIDGGLTATQLGIRTYTAGTKLSNFNYGVGVPTFGGFDLPTETGTDLTISSTLGPALGSFEIDLSDATSLGDVVTAINAQTAGSITAQITADGTAIELVDTAGGTFDLTVQRGPVAQYLGLVPADQTEASTTTGTLTGNNSGYIDFSLTARDGQTFGVDLSAAKTVGEVLTAINSAAGVVGVNVTAQIAASGNGIELVDTTGGGGSLTVTAAEGSQAAEFLGLVVDGETPNVSTTNTLTGTDQNFLETDSVFNTLIRLRDALQNDDINAIERAIAKIESDIGRITSSRAEVGARVRGLEQSQQTLQLEEIQLRSALSDEIDVDLIEAISQLTARQVSLEASLRSTANILQLSLLNFL